MTFSANVDSARNNLASSFVNGFVNAGFGRDKMVVPDAESTNNWIYKTKDHGTYKDHVHLTLADMDFPSRYDQCYSIHWYDSLMGCGSRFVYHRQVHVLD